MDTDGFLAPADAAAARDRYAALGPTAQVLVKEVAKAMGMDAEEYDERVTSEVVATARDALFASLLEVHVGTRAEFEAWQADNPDVVVHEVGSENVDNLAWHVAGATDAVVAATFQDEERAARETLRRQAFGRVYRDLVAGDDTDGDAGGDAGDDANAARD